MPARILFLTPFRRFALRPACNCRIGEMRQRELRPAPRQRPGLFMPRGSSCSPFLFFPVFRPGLPVFSCFRFQRFSRSFNARPCIFLYFFGSQKFFRRGAFWRNETNGGRVADRRPSASGDLRKAWQRQRFPDWVCFARIRKWLSRRSVNPVKVVLSGTATSRGVRFRTPGAAGRRYPFGHKSLHATAG